MRIVLFLTAALLVLSSCSANAHKKSKRWIFPESVIDIDNKDDANDVEAGSGGGDEVTMTDDEDMLDSGSGYSGDGEGSADGEDIHVVTETPKTTRPLKICEKVLNSTELLRRFPYKPKCTDSGHFEKMQCRSDPGIGDCWCVGPDGLEIPGTLMRGPRTPDCQFGVNLKPCAYHMLRNRHGQLGTYTPRCTKEGYFEKIQCHEAECWCVSETGEEQIDTRTHSSAKPICIGTTTMASTSVKSTKKPHHHKPPHIGHIDRNKNKDGYNITKHTGVVIDDIDTTEKPGDDKTNVNISPLDPIEEGDNEENDLQKGEQTPSEVAQNFLAKPFIMGAIIAGAVVGLLGAILLVMFIVYRLRKKDEGSYALEEQKFTNYSYMKAPDKEFYA